ncbi:DUF1648 domain-containing protein [Actinoplanes sp. NPDC024001]|uniref:DUF1648 domain-containing protein n=1 Tax=Actinoplanes sp. NPDC024001 TaxID=3154598 RepID=UPI00340E7EFE
MRRLWAAAVLVWLPVAVTAATWGSWSGRLPARVATHWGPSGAPDRFSSTEGFWTTMVVIGVVAGVVAVVAAVVAARAERLTRGADGTGPPRAADGGTEGRDVGRGASRTDDGVDREAIGVAARRLSNARFLLVGAGAASGATAGMWAATATAALADPVEPRLGWRFLYFAAGLAWGLVVWLAAGRVSRPVLPVGPAVNPLALGPTERAGFSTTLRAPLIAGVTLASAVLVMVLALTGPPALWFVALIPLAAGLAFGRIRVTADRRGLRLVTGLFGVPVKRIPLGDIAGAEVAEIDPMAWGGWGYRVTPGRSALVLRAGPGLVLQLRDGRRFAVTLDDPQTPAALLNALLNRVAG